MLLKLKILNKFSVKNIKMRVLPNKNAQKIKNIKIIFYKPSNNKA